MILNEKLEKYITSLRHFGKDKEEICYSLALFLDKNNFRSISQLDYEISRSLWAYNNLTKEHYTKVILLGLCGCFVGFLNNEDLDLVSFNNIYTIPYQALSTVFEIDLPLSKMDFVRFKFTLYDGKKGSMVEYLSILKETLC